MTQLIYLLLGITMLAQSSASLSAPVSPVAAVAQSEQAKEWADSVYNSLTEQQRVAQLMVPRLDIPDSAAGRAPLKQMVDAGVGGILLGKGTVADYKGLIAYGQSLARVPLLATLDGEWGLAMRVTDAPRYPYNMSLGAIQAPSLIRDYGREVAAECRAVGIHVNFAPVLDVNSNPANPVIGFRSFGEDPDRVSALGVAYAQGLEDGGVMSVAKHFPGHGDTSTDSHKTLPKVTHNRDYLNKVDLYPFQQYIDGGLSGVMVGHLNVPALDASGTPASMSYAVTTGLLKDDMKFDGLVWTDGLAMKGADMKENNCVAALRAGADVLLQPADPIADITTVLNAVKSGKISRERLRDACIQLLRYKYALIVAAGNPARKKVNSDEAEAINHKLSAAAITCIKNVGSLVPVGDLRHRSVAVVSIGAQASNAFSKGCRRYTDCSLFGSPSGALDGSQIAKIKKCDVVVVGLFSHKEAAVKSLAALTECRNVVVVSFLNPYKLKGFASSLVKAAVLLSASDDTPALRDCASQAVFGGIAVTGRMPVAVGGVCKAGDGIDIARTRLGYSTPIASGADASLTSRIDSIVEGAIRAGAFPGCQIAVAKRGEIIFNKAYGTTTRGKSGVPVTTGTLYDLASMTKATATTSAVMAAIDQGLMKLDAPLNRYIEVADSLPIANITIRQLLTHHTGLPASNNVAPLMSDPDSYTAPLTSAKRSDTYSVEIESGIYGNTDLTLRRDLTSDSRTDDFDLEIAPGLYVGDGARQAILEKILSITPSSPSYKYSDLNFVLLAEAVEGATECALDQWVDLEIFSPLGVTHPRYRAADSTPLDSIAPTENDRWLRHATLHGYVHDETASFSGGVQGNAGLFSNAADIAALCQMWLQRGSYGPETIISPETVDAFISPKAITSDGLRFPGFDRLRSNKVAGLSDGVFGHTGFTGTCFWVDPEKELIYVFLSNRVNPSRINKAWSKCDPRRPILREILKAYSSN